MIDLLLHWINDSLPEGESLQTKEALTAKVEGRRLLPFHGNTLLFALKDTVKSQLAALQTQLYADCEPLLAEPLEDFHMTLHDLVSGAPSDALRAEMDDVARWALPMLAALRQQYTRTITMKPTRLFIMDRTSVVLGLSPTDVGSWWQLAMLYGAVQAHPDVRLPYELTPHITLAYLRPGCYDARTLEPLRWFLQQIVLLRLQLRMEDLMLAEFTDMNHYRRADGA